MASKLEINLVWILSIMNEKFSVKEDRVGEKKKGSPERYIDHVGKKNKPKRKKTKDKSIKSDFEM